MYVKNDGGNYVDLNKVESLHAEEVPASSGDWKIKVSNWNDERWILNGTWASEADAQEAIRQLVDGVDPATYGA